jgi:thiamine transport system substrate-binding protein
MKILNYLSKKTSVLIRQSVAKIATISVIAVLSMMSIHADDTDSLSDTPDLKIYTYDSFVADWGPGPKLVELFEAQCQCKVEMIGVTDALNILTRLRFEGEDTEADVIIGLDNNTIHEADELGLIAKHDVDLTALEMPIEWSSDTFIPFDYGYFAFVYNKTNENIKKPATTFADFISEKDTTIIMQDPRTSSVGLGIVSWIQKIYGEKSAEVWRQLNDRIVTISPGWGEAYSLFLQGDSDYVLSYTTSPAYHLIAEDDDNYASLTFEEGHYLQIEAAARLKTSKRPKLANDFLQFLVTAEAQSTIAQSNWMYPVSEPKPAMPENYPEKPQVPGLYFTSEEVTEDKTKWIQSWLDVLSE